MLTEREKLNVKAKYEELGTYRGVARLLGIIDRTVKRVVENLHIKDKKAPGPKKKVTTRQVKSITRNVRALIAKEQKVTARKVQFECALTHVSRRTVQRQLKSTGYNYKEAQRSIVLSAAHKQKRVEITEQ